MNDPHPAAKTDVLVVGGGPAGATTAALLAREGFAVTLLEKARFPRYHIGESLLPSLLPLLDLLGARQAVEAHGFVRKRGAYYDWGGQQWALHFDHLGPEAPYSFQVVRADFDHALLDHARHQGVRVHEQTAVGAVAFHDGRPRSATWTAPDGHQGSTAFTHLVDASGRAGLLTARHLRLRRFHDAFRNVATWAYWQGVAPVPGAPEGAICLYSLPDHGWFWAIPLHDGTLSVGLVTDKRSFAQARTELGSAQALYTHHLARTPALADLLADARQATGVRVESDYSYVCDRFCGPGWYAAGDAACFLDPLLSTGVHLAMHSGLLAAASIAATLRHDTTASRAAAFYQAAYRHAYERLLVLVGAFYDIHQGRDAHFRRAQQLSHRDQKPLRLHESFLHIVTGVEDLHDTQDHAVPRLFAALRDPLPGHSPVGLGGHGASRMTPWPTTPDHAVAGLRLVLRPHLTLRSAEG
ncbi:NAD(P)/FAD-dependent oxidoreductase [Streptomyces antimicrobicus]|uniref:FAD-dependent oxidoreductase n=1 Tax=Streptomyces antimicrobicus TaxID=2883108 RepID=A0ABS8B5C9_9ACTN|nr:FAD-dependent oxidoreductase [Streptomyces antimicrobicus]MCB5179816.1 FAD-dependent oxidoreductase [Streptomyces antimicrobicus]